MANGFSLSSSGCAGGPWFAAVSVEAMLSVRWGVVSDFMAVIDDSILFCFVMENRIWLSFAKSLRVSSSKRICCSHSRKLYHALEKAMLLR